MLLVQHEALNTVKLALPEAAITHEPPSHWMLLLHWGTCTCCLQRIAEMRCFSSEGTSAGVLMHSWL